VLNKLRIEQDVLFKEVQSLSRQNAELQQWNNRLAEELTWTKVQLKETQQQKNLLQQDNEQLKDRLALTKGMVANLQRQIFAPKTEKTNSRVQNLACVKRKRGKQPNTPGFGRTVRSNLTTKETFHELPLADRCCKQCGKEYRTLPWAKESQEIDIVVELIRLVHKRRRYKKVCDCLDAPNALIAPVPSKLIPKGLFSTRFIGEVLIEKYLLQRPINRILKKLAMHGLSVSDGTIVGNLKQLYERKMFENLSEFIKDRSRCAPHWHWDETRWKVFEYIEGKTGNNWWLWVCVSQDTAVYLIEPFRNSSIPEEYLATVAQGIISCDRYSGYQPLRNKFKLAYCWSHVRRDFLKVRNGHAEEAPKAQDWVERIDDLFEQNQRRCQFTRGSKEFVEEDKKVRALLKRMEGVMAEQLLDPKEHPHLAAALTSLKKYWEGFNIFLDNSEIPMDNNKAERQLRNPVVGRKNYYGSGSQWAGEFAAQMMTVLETIEMNGLDVRKWLNEYLEACAKNGGYPPDNVQEWLPWNMSEERKAQLAKPTKNRK
jgi:transposase